MTSLRGGTIQKLDQKHIFIQISECAIAFISTIYQINQTGVLVLYHFIFELLCHYSLPSRTN